MSVELGREASCSYTRWMGIIGLPLGPLMVGILLGLVCPQPSRVGGGCRFRTSQPIKRFAEPLVSVGSHRADADDDCRWIFPRVALKLNEGKVLQSAGGCSLFLVGLRGESSCFLQRLQPDEIEVG